VLLEHNSLNLNGEFGGAARHPVGSASARPQIVPCGSDGMAAGLAVLGRSVTGAHACRPDAVDASTSRRQYSELLRHSKVVAIRRVIDDLAIPDSVPVDVLNFKAFAGGLRFE
jgi:hypothetical protein